MAGLGDTTDLQLYIERRYPAPGGYLECMGVEGLEPPEMLSLLRERHGPGRYRVRPYGRLYDEKGNPGKMGYLRGAATVTIAPLPGMPDVHTSHHGGTVVIDRQPAMHDNPIVGELLRHALKAGQGQNSELFKLLGVLLTREQKPIVSGPATDLEGVLRVAERLNKMSRGGAKDNEDNSSLERAALLAIVNRILSPDPVPRRPPDRPRQVAAAAATANPTKKPPQRRPPPTPTPTRAAPRDDDDDDDDVTLEQEIREHLEEMAAANPADAAAWVVSEVLNQLPPSVAAVLQRQFFPDAGEADDGQVDDENVIPIPNRRPPDV